MEIQQWTGRLRLRFCLLLCLTWRLSLQQGRAEAAPSNVESSLEETAKIVDLALNNQIAIGLMMLIFCTLILIGVIRFIPQAFGSERIRSFYLRGHWQKSWINFGMVTLLFFYYCSHHCLGAAFRAP